MNNNQKGGQRRGVVACGRDTWATTPNHKTLKKEEQHVEIIPRIFKSMLVKDPFGFKNPKGAHCCGCETGQYGGANPVGNPDPGMYEDNPPSK